MDGNGWYRQNGDGYEVLAACGHWVAVRELDHVELCGACRNLAYRGEVVPMPRMDLLPDDVRAEYCGQ